MIGGTTKRSASPQHPKRCGTPGAKQCIPIASILVPFWVEPTTGLRSYILSLVREQKGTTMETRGRILVFRLLGLGCSLVGYLHPISRCLVASVRVWALGTRSRQDVGMEGTWLCWFSTKIL